MFKYDINDKDMSGYIANMTLAVGALGSQMTDWLTHAGTASGIKMILDAA